MPIVTVLIVAALVAGRITLSRPTAQLLPPTALTAIKSTTDTVKFSWKNPVNGHVPDKYRIWWKGRMIGSVSASTTSFAVGGLIPDTRYKFRVSAVLAGRSSRWSQVLMMSTARPGRSAAVLAGAWPSTVKVIKVKPKVPASTFYVGLKWSNIWQFTLNCSVGPCSVRLRGELFGYGAKLVPFIMNLSRSGYTYSGHIATKADLCPGSPPVPTPGTLAIKILLTRDGLDGDRWSAKSWSGDLVIKTRPRKNDTCPRSVISGTIQSSGSS